MYITFSLVLIVMSASGGLATAVIPTRMNEEQCTAEAARIKKAYWPVNYAFCVKTEGR